MQVYSCFISDEHYYSCICANACMLDNEVLFSAYVAQSEYMQGQSNCSINRLDCPLTMQLIFRLNTLPVQSSTSVAKAGVANPSIWRLFQL